MDLTPRKDGKDPAAVEFGRRGGKASAKNMTAKQRHDRAVNAARARLAKRAMAASGAPSIQDSA